MKTLFLDCFSGISGDMLLGVLIDLGIEHDQFIAELNKLKLDDYTLQIVRQPSYGIQATDVTVQMEHSEAADCHAHHGRHLSDCLQIIEASTLSDWVKTHAARVFREVAAAEAHVHAQPIESVHFHEVGAVDSIVDIVGTFIGLEALGIKRVYASTLHDGTGFVTCAHGRLPVPVPAVAQMLASSKRHIPYKQQAIETELITPTGLAIVKTIAAEFGPMPDLAIERVGYGTGKRDIGQLNALRGFLGEMNAQQSEAASTCLLEANIDDQSSEVLAFAMERLLEAGALDVFFTPIYMKKNRPAYKLSVLSKATDTDKMMTILFAETSTLGVRTFPCNRRVMSRDFRIVSTPYGPVTIKRASFGSIMKSAPEFEDCARLARTHHLPLRTIYDAARHADLLTD
ncbi:MAG: nickel pincer cofactor biosynthesis protein LarC [Sporolactobacillus sp.]